MSETETTETATIDCRLNCDLPPGVELAEVPTPRHAWGDCIVCPNEDCDKAFLVVRNPHEDNGSPPQEGEQ